MNFICKLGFHRFKPRYNYTPPERPLPTINGSGSMAKTLRTLGTETYIHDVCERCGKTIRGAK